MSRHNERNTAMSIVARPEFDTVYKLIISDPEISRYSSQLIAPMVRNQSVGLYCHLVSGLSVSTQMIGTAILRKILEKMDLEFRNAPERTSRWYVKNTRERTIITLFGEVTYQRTEYVDRTTGVPFVYVDEEIGLFRRQRYDSTIAALAYDYYSHQSSMIEVGKMIGERIAGFRLDPARGGYTISRQQIFNMINRFQNIKTKPVKAEETPETLYIMADEKYIHLQQEAAAWRNEMLDKGHTIKEINELEKKMRFNEMVKLAVVFTGREKLTKKDGGSLKWPRWQLTDTRYLAFPHDTKNFWPRVMDELSAIYDMEKVKRIYILGDGAEWIKAGAAELSSQYCSAKFALDRYHMSKQINAIVKDKAYRRLLTDYVIHGDKESFTQTVDSLYADTPMPKKAADALTYLLNNMGFAVVMQNEVKIGCAMEQAISHVLASPFTCIPKAYVSVHLHTYVQARMFYKNHLDSLKIYIAACDQTKAKQRMNDFSREADLSKEHLDFSMFDTKASMPYYHLNLDTVMKKQA